MGCASPSGSRQPGYSVVLHCSEASRGEAEAAAARMTALGRNARALPCDLLDPEMLGALVGKAKAIFGPLVLLVNSAAIFKSDDAASFDLDLWEKHFSVNLKAPLILSRDFANQLPAGTEGAIVNIIDQRVLRPTPQFFTYSLSKSALFAATRTMAQAFAPQGIRVNAVGPGPVSPNFNQGEAGFAREVGGLPLGPRDRAGRYRRRGSLSCQCPQCDRPNDRRRCRPASCLANARCRALVRAQPHPVLARPCASPRSSEHETR